ncbi:MAG TPA: hypothetical protein DCK98_01170 [Chloroflexi bacterium]|jgi:hypothetical protein|nr:hypothetical protein [Chloroflexota bacterium]HAL27663.1 hypothetical protein [Chloroflexota bacterium]
MSDLWQVVFVTLFGVIVAEGFAILALGRAVGMMQLRLGPEPLALETSDGLAVGSEVPPIGGIEFRSREFTTISATVGRWLLIFVDAGCQSCRDLTRDAGRVSQGRWDARVVLIARSTHEQNEALQELAPKTLLISDPAGAIHDAFSITRTPSAMLVENGRVHAKGVANTRDQLELMLELHRTRKLPPGEEAWLKVPASEAHQAPTRQGVE